jgi:hypothetical protein
MSAIPKHPKRRGEWVELQFMARAASYGLKLCKPWGDTARYDVVVEHPAGFHRVQVKSTSHLRGHRWECNLSRQAYVAEDFDYLAVYIIPQDVWYIIPFAAIRARRMISLRDPRLGNGRYRRYREAWHQLADNDLDAVCLGRDQNSVSKSRSIGQERRRASV